VMAEGDAGGADRDAGGSDSDRAAINAAIVATLLESAPVGFALFDEGLVFQLINERLAEMNGLSVAEHLGRYAFDVLPELRVSAEPLLRAVLETGEPLRDVEISGETPAQPGILRHWLESFFPVRTPSGRIVGLAAIATEITDRIRLERQASETADLLQAVLDSAPVGLAVVDGDHRFVRINDALATMNGLSAQDHLGRRLGDLLPPEMSVVTQLIETVFGSGEPLINQELAGVGPSGELMEVLAHYYPIRNGSGAVERVGVVVMDQTENNRRHRQENEGLRRRMSIQDAALDELQTMLLPSVPPLPGLIVEVRYLPAESVVGIGGDWYDAFPLDGKAVLAVGDAVGHGLPAIRTMETSRSAIRALTRAGLALDEVIRHANRVFTEDAEDGAFATLCVAVSDSASGELVYALAGHPPPMIRRPSGDIVTLEHPRIPPLGLLGDRAVPLGHAHLHPGDTLLLYTDGLVERRRESIDIGLDRLRSALAGPMGPSLGAQADRIVDEVLRGSAREDDACLLMASAVPRTGG
jgi:PAS domain S-box-containing protein